MKPHHSGLLMIFFLMSCKEPGVETSIVVPTPVKGQSVFVDSGQKKEIMQLCRELNQIGQMLNARTQIDQDMREIDQRLRQLKIENEQERLTFLTNRIIANTEAMNQMVGQKFTSEEVRQKIRWNLIPEHFGLTKEKKWSIQNVRVEKVYGSHGIDEKARKDLKVNWSDQSVSVLLQRPSTPLILCQLQHALVVHLRVEVLRERGATTAFHFKLMGRKMGGME